MNQSCQTEGAPLNLPDFSKLGMFFHHPTYKRASQDAKKTLTRVIFQNEFTVTFDNKMFEEKKGGERVCRKRIENKYYECKDCQLENNSCLCEQCFDFELHRDHNFNVRHSSGYCDCGIKYRWKEEGFCACHRTKPEEKIQISEEVHEKFITFFRDCFQIYFELVYQSLPSENKDDANSKHEQMVKGAKVYIKELLKELTRLNIRSPFYNQLTTQLLLTEISVSWKEKENKKPAPILFHLITKNSNYLTNTFADLIVSLSENDNIIKLFFKTCYQEKTQNQVQNFNSFSKAFFQLSDYLHIYNQLAVEGVLAYYRGNQNAKQMIDYYLKINKRFNDKFYEKQYGKFLNVWKEIDRKGLLTMDNFSEDKLIPLFQDCSTDGEMTKKILLVYFQFIEKRISEFDQSENSRKERTEIVSNYLNKTIKVLAEAYGPFSDKIAGQFIEICKSEDFIRKFLRQAFQELLNSPNKMSQLTVRVCAEVFINLKQKQIFLMEDIVKNLVNLNVSTFKGFVTIFINACAFQNTKYSWILNVFAKGEEKKSFEKKAQLEFKKYLCTYKQVHQTVIKKFKAMKWLEFPSAGDLLDEYTTFDNTQKQFIYKSTKEKYQDISVFTFDDLVARSDQFPIVFVPEENDERFSQIQIPEDFPYRNNLKATIMEIIAPFFKDFEEKQIKISSSIQNEDDDSKFVKTCIIADKIVNGAILPLRKQLKQIEKRVHQDQLPLFFNEFRKRQQETLEKVESPIKQERPLQKVQQSQTKVIENPSTPVKSEEKKQCQPVSEQSEAKKKILKAKMEKFKKKFGKTREKHLNEVGLKESPDKAKEAKEKMEDDLEHLCCIVCKEPKEAGNNMFYLAKTKTQKLLYSFFNKSLACDQVFETCMHPMHEKCFIQFIGNNSSKNCPLCQRSINCILPLAVRSQEQTEEQEDYNQIWRNRIIYVSIREHSNYNVQETAIMLLKGLVGRNGLMEILQPQTKDFEFNTNTHLFKVMKSSYEGYDEKQNKKIERKFNKMIEFTQKNPSLGIGLIQETLLKAYWGQISKNIQKEENIEELRILLNKLKKLLIPNEFALIQKQVESITKYTMEIDDEIQSITQGRMPVFDLEPPRSAQEMLRLRQHCKKCTSVRGWYCMICKITYCYECDMINDHRNTVHAGNCIIIPLISGALKTMSKEEGSEDFTIYRNKFMEEWDNSNSKNTGQYKLNEERYRYALNKWLRSN